MSVLSLLEQGGVTMIPLAICSVLVIAVIFERVWGFARIGKMPQDLFRRVEGLLATGDATGGLRHLEESDSPYARVAIAGMLHETNDPEEIRDLLTVACEEEVALATRTQPVLGTIGTIAPFIGLMGTVIGIMRAFAEVASQGTAGASVVSAGISEALITTIAGLGVGIVAVIANNWTSARVESYRLKLERFATLWAYRLRHFAHECPETTTEISV